MSSKFLEWLNILASAFFIILLFIVLINALSFYIEFYQFQVANGIPLKGQLYSIGVIIAVVTILGQWIEGRTRGIIRSANSLKRRKKWQKKRKKKSLK